LNRRRSSLESVCGPAGVHTHKEKGELKMIDGFFTTVFTEDNANLQEIR